MFHQYWGWFVCICWLYWNYWLLLISFTRDIPYIIKIDVTKRIANIYKKSISWSMNQWNMNFGMKQIAEMNITYEVHTIQIIKSFKLTKTLMIESLNCFLFSSFKACCSFFKNCWYLFCIPSGIIFLFSLFTFLGSFSLELSLVEELAFSNSDRYLFLASYWSYLLRFLNLWKFSEPISFSLISSEKLPADPKALSALLQAFCESYSLDWSSLHLRTFCCSAWSCL